MLSDCVWRDPSVAELYIVQPQKAHALAKAARDRMSQAILLIEGSLLRVGSASIEDVLNDENCKSIVCAFGVGFSLAESHGEGGCVSLEHLRYGKIILVVESGLKGDDFCFAQVISLLYRYLHPVLAKGHVFMLRVSDSALTFEAYFTYAALTPEKRSLTQLVVGRTLESTLKLNRLGPPAS